VFFEVQMTAVHQRGQLTGWQAASPRLSTCRPRPALFELSSPLPFCWVYTALRSLLRSVDAFAIWLRYVTLVSLRTM